MPPARRRTKTSRERDALALDLLLLCRSSGVELVHELRFAPPRLFRFDFALPTKRIAIEYEGVYGGKSRHTTVSGYTRDCEKYNLAVAGGWRVLRYTAPLVAEGRHLRDLELLLT